MDRNVRKLVHKDRFCNVNVPSCPVIAGSTLYFKELKHTYTISIHPNL